ncbi:ABC transporter ATP-binding protein [Acuticoccus sp.]|uniref:ABC transporter ATP-binding protein n=1 Tax=Acuticoccus sp. TaxID=1904378 RepID=UPI003B523D60
MLALDDVHAGYGRVQVLNGLSLTVPEGAIIALLGGNGTGKSTALKVAAGLLEPTSGEVRFDGVRIDDVPADRRIGMGLVLVPQGKEVFAGMSVQENLLVGAYHRRRAKAEVRADLEARYAEFPKLAAMRSRSAGALSGGERQMLSIARALMGRPRLLMLDEPSAALAPRVVQEIAEIVLDLNERGLTILLVEQNVAMAMAIAEHLYIMREGAIAFDRPITEGDDDADDLKAYYLGQSVG